MSDSSQVSNRHTLSRRHRDGIAHGITLLIAQIARRRRVEPRYRAMSFFGLPAMWYQKSAEGLDWDVRV